MQNYHNYIGIDIGKLEFYVATHAQKQVDIYENSSQGINAFIKAYATKLKHALCVLETTGGYEIELLYTLCHKGISMHRANTRKVKHFICSYREHFKTDKLDAQTLAFYGYERHKSLELFQPKSKQDLILFKLVQRRLELTKMLVAEKNRAKAPGMKELKNSFKQMIAAIQKQIDKTTQHIKDIIEKDKIFEQKCKVLKTIPGIGEVVSFELLTLLPELGQVNRRQIASLAGLAPIARESGSYMGYRKTGHGRSDIKPILFLSAMAARNSNSELKSFYEKLIASGKKKKVALTALMRKILVIANARLRDLALET